MNYSKYRFNLDMQSYISQVSLPVRQHDTGIVLRINLTDGGVPYHIKDGCRAVFYARKADGKPLMNDCVIEKNTTICYELTQQTTTCSGVVDCEVRLYGSDGNLITTPRFILVIDSRVVHDEDFPLSEEEQTVLDNIILTEQARAAAEAEREKASAEALADAERASELVDDLLERLKNEDLGDEELRLHNENDTAHKAAFEAHDADATAHIAIFGEGNERGIKGFWISAIGTVNDQIVLSDETVRSNVGKPTVSEYVDSDWLDIPYAVGDEFSVITPKDHYHLCGKILSCAMGNRLEVEYYTTINWDAGDPTDNNDYAFFVPSKPDAGIIDVSNGGFATGYYTRAGGDDTHSEGVYTQAIGSYSHAEGLRTWSGYSAHAEGSDTKAVGKYAHAEGFKTEAKGGSSHAEGELTKASGNYSHAEGKETVASAFHTHAEGWKSKATADNAHAEGYSTTASGGSSHAEGAYSYSIGQYSHAEGYNTRSSGNNAHTEGNQSVASGSNSHAGGDNCTASGASSHASGAWSNAKGVVSFAHGDSCNANSDKSVAFGYFTETSESQPSQFATGELNKLIDHALFMVGNGASTSERSNAFAIKSQGRGNGANVSMVLGNTEIPETSIAKILSLTSGSTAIASGTSSLGIFFVPFNPKMIVVIADPQEDFMDENKTTRFLGIWAGGNTMFYTKATVTPPSADTIVHNIASVGVNTTQGMYQISMSANGDNYLFYHDYHYFAIGM